MSGRSVLVARGVSFAAIIMAWQTPAAAQVQPVPLPTPQRGAAGVAPSAGEQTVASPAAQTPAGDPNQGADIVVTAQFRGQRLQETPIAITAVAGDTLTERNQTNIADIGTYTPNAQLNKTTGNSASGVSAFIRGIGQNDASFAFEPGVGIYVDDVYYGTTFGANLDLTDLDRVEVLRGPQGTLAGKNSLGGAVRLFSKKPDANPEGFVEASYGRFDRLDIRGSANFALTNGLFVRLSGAHKESEGYVRELDFGCVNPGQGIVSRGSGRSDCVIGRSGGENLTALRGAVRFAPEGSSLEINVVGDVSRDRSQPNPNVLLYANNPAVRSYVAANPLAGVPYDSRFLSGPNGYTNFSTYGDGGNYTTSFGTPTQVVPGTFPDGPANRANAWGVATTIDYALSDNLTIKSITAWRHADGFTVLDTDASPLSVIKQRSVPVHDQFTQELRLSGKVGTLADFTLGGFYYNANDRSNDRIQLPYLLYDLQSGDRIDNRSIAGFGHLELHPVQRLNVILGLRYTDDKKSYVFGRRNADGSVISGIPLTTNFLLLGLDGLSSQFKGSRLDYRVGLNYQVTPTVLGYAQVATGFKGGGVNPQPFVADQALPFGPEKLTTYEVGFKTQFLDRAVTANGAVFYNDYTGIQRTIFACPFSVSAACSLTTNAGDGRSVGAELELNVRPLRGLLLNGSLGYIDFEYKRINPATGITLDMDAPYTSKWTASGGIQYIVDVANGQTITPRLDWNYRSRFFAQAVTSSLNDVPGRSLFDARLTYALRDQDVSISGSVTNVFNKYSYITKAEVAAVLGYGFGVVAPPRRWAITVRKTF